MSRLICLVLILVLCWWLIGCFVCVLFWRFDVVVLLVLGFDAFGIIDEILGVVLVDVVFGVVWGVVVDG